MARSVHDTVDEIELETNHTEGWVIHAYIKVFNKWLDNVGRTNATFGHIKDAVSESIDSKEASDQVLCIERFDLFC
jgi:ribosome biogenesis protein Nip4